MWFLLVDAVGAVIVHPDTVSHRYIATNGISCHLWPPCWWVSTEPRELCLCPVHPPQKTQLQEYWSGLPFPSPRNLPDPGIEPGFPAWQARFFAI